MDLQLETRRSGETTIVSVAGEIDHFSASQLRDALLAAADAGARVVVADLGPTDFLDSSGLGALMAVAKQEQAAQLVVVCPKPHLRKLFAIAHLDEVLDVRSSLDDVSGT